MREVVNIVLPLFAAVGLFQASVGLFEKKRWSVYLLHGTGLALGLIEGGVVYALLDAGEIYETCGTVLGSVGLIAPELQRRTTTKNSAKNAVPDGTGRGD